MIDPLDRGFTLGDGLFETVLWQEGRLQRLGPHLNRLTAGCEALGLPPPDLAEAERRMLQAVREAGLASARVAVRLTLTAGVGGRGLDRPERPSPTLIATAALAPVPTTQARLVTAAARRNEGSPASRWKTLAYLDNVLARQEARAAGADEALMLNVAGEIACAAAANIFWVDEDGRLCTPALDCGVLAGVVRAAVLEAAAALGLQALEVRAGREALDGARHIFVTNSLIGVRGVEALDGRPLAPWDGLAALAAAVT